MASTEGQPPQRPSPNMQLDHIIISDGPYVTKTAKRLGITITTQKISLTPQESLSFQTRKITKHEDDMYEVSQDVYDLMYPQPCGGKRRAPVIEDKHFVKAQPCRKKFCIKPSGKRQAGLDNKAPSEPSRKRKAGTEDDFETDNEPSRKKYKSAPTTIRPKAIELPAKRPMGFENKRVHCYSNSVLQGLAATLDPMRLRTDLGEKHLGSRTRANIDFSCPEKLAIDLQVQSEPRRRFNPAKGLIRMLEALEDCNRDTAKLYPPYKLQSSFARVAPSAPDREKEQWYGNTQEDAAEYLRLICECLSQGGGFAQHGENPAPHPGVHRLFQVRNQYEMRCRNPECKKKVWQFGGSDEDWLLPLQVPPETVIAMKLAEDVQHSTVELLDHRRESEFLKDYKCDSCKGVGVDKIWTGIENPPEVLITQFDRKGPVCPGKQSHEPDAIPKLKYGVRLNETLQQDSENDYQLAAVVKHSGEGFGVGHYTAFVKTQGGWWWCNDERVTAASLEDVRDPKKGGDTYLAFYRRAP